MNINLICAASAGLIACYILDIVFVLVILCILYVMFIKKPKSPTNNINISNESSNSESEYIIETDDYKPKSANSTKSQPNDDKLNSEASYQTKSDDKSMPNASKLNFEPTQAKIEAKPQIKEQKSDITTSKLNESDEKIKNFKHKIIKSEQITRNESSTKKHNAQPYEKSESLINSIKTAVQSDTFNDKK